jgi:hypothetical protein
MASIGRGEVEAVALCDGVGEGIGRRDRHDAGAAAAGYEVGEIGEPVGIPRCCSCCHIGLVRVGGGRGSIQSWLREKAGGGSMLPPETGRAGRRVSIGCP